MYRSMDNKNNHKNDHPVYLSKPYREIWIINTSGCREEHRWQTDVDNRQLLHLETRHFIHILSFMELFQTGIKKKKK